MKTNSEELLNSGATQKSLKLSPLNEKSNILYQTPKTMVGKKMLVNECYVNEC